MNNRIFPRQRRLYALQRVIIVGQHVLSFTIRLLYLVAANVIRSVIHHYYADLPLSGTLRIALRPPVRSFRPDL